MSKSARRVVVYCFLALATLVGITFSSDIYPDNPGIGQMIVVGAAVVIAFIALSKDKDFGNKK